MDSNRTTGNILKQFGDYLIIDHIKDGGMAKVFRACFLKRAANKIVVIKMMKSTFVEDQDFVKMFLDEAKVSFKLIHPNIAQTYDSGIRENNLYTVMEYVQGKSLRDLMTTLKQKGQRLGIDDILYITSQAALGLTYAHDFADPLTGKKECLIHRDINPNNIMITYNGGVKIIDFGIAKNEMTTRQTQAGVLKGSVPYMAPEYIEGKKIGATYDQFSLGVCLWEMLVGDFLFNESNNIATLKKILDCEIQSPSVRRKEIPRELDPITLRALSKNPEKRYPNMDSFAKALLKALGNISPGYTPSDLGKKINNLFKEEIEADKANLQKLDIEAITKSFSDHELKIEKEVDLNIDITSPNFKLPKQIEEEAKRPPAEEVPSPSTENTGTDTAFVETIDDLKVNQLIKDKEAEAEKVEQKESEKKREEAQSTSKTRKLGDKPLRPTTPVKYNIPSLPEKRPPAPTTNAAIKTQNYIRSFFIKRQTLLIRALSTLSSLVLILTIAYFITPYLKFSSIKPPDEIKKEIETSLPTPPLQEAASPPETRTKGIIKFLGLTEEKQVFVNGKLVKSSNPALTLPIGKKIEIKVKYKQGKEETDEVTLTTKEPELLYMVP